MYGLFVPSDTILRVNEGGGGGGSCESYTTMYMHLFLTSNMSIHLMHVATNDC